jgi:formate hydrogenlyase subunit 4
MILLVLSLIAAALHAAIVFAAAPLLTGIITKFRARLLGRPGAPVLQPYRDLAKFLAKTPILPDTATQLYQAWPFAALAATGTAALLIPSFTLGMATAKLSDFITLIGLFAVARAATMLASVAPAPGGMRCSAFLPKPPCWFWCLSLC